MKAKINDEQSIVQSFVNRANLDMEMTAAFRLYRYECVLKLIDDAIEGKRPVGTQNDSKLKRAIIDNTVNVYRRIETQRLSEQKAACLERISAFRDECKDNGITLPEVTKESLRQTAESAFGSDKSGLQKIYFAMLLCLKDNDGDDLEFWEDTQKSVSEILFGDELKTERIKDKFYRNFRAIYGESFWERNKYFLIGAGASLALVAVMTPFALGGLAAGSAVIASCLAQIGHCAPAVIGAGIASVTGMTLLGTLVLGGGVLAGLGIDRLIKNKEAKEAFRKLAPDDVAALLAMKATLMDFGMTETDSQTMKAEMDGCLLGLSDLRSDAEYMLIVEKCDAENCKKKIRICNRFVDRLATIAGI